MSKNCPLQPKFHTNFSLPNTKHKKAVYNCCTGFQQNVTSLSFRAQLHTCTLQTGTEHVGETNMKETLTETTNEHLSSRGNQDERKEFHSQLMQNDDKTL